MQEKGPLNPESLDLRHDTAICHSCISGSGCRDAWIAEPEANPMYPVYPTLPTYSTHPVLYLHSDPPCPFPMQFITSDLFFLLPLSNGEQSTCIKVSSACSIHCTAQAGLLDAVHPGAISRIGIPHSNHRLSSITFSFSPGTSQSRIKQVGNKYLQGADVRANSPPLSTSVSTEVALRIKTKAPLQHCTDI